MRNLMVGVCIFMLANVIGCTTTSGQYGSFLVSQPSASLNDIATDAAGRLSMTWLPAKTRLVLQHPSTDAFGEAFIKALRGKGYAILELDPSSKVTQENDAAKVSYILDHVGEIYRLTLVVNRQVLSRAYLVNRDRFSPSGAWTVKQESL